MRIELPKENWAELRDADDVTERLRRPIMRAMSRVSVAARLGMDQLPKVDAKAAPEVRAAQQQKLDEALLEFAMSDEDIAAMSEANDLTVVAMVASWSYEASVTYDSVLDLPTKAYDKLRQVCAPMVLELFTDFSPNPDNKSPFEHSSESSTSPPEEGSSLTTFPKMSGATTG